MNESGPRFALAGSWARIPLSSEAATLSSIRKMTEQITGRMDQLATLRAEMRARFVKAADVARSGGATDMFIGLELVPGIPLPAWIAVFPADYESADLSTIGFSDLVRSVDFSTGPAIEGGTKRESDIASPTPIHAVRHAWRRTTDVVEGDAEQKFEFIEADYWVVASDPNRLALVTFSSALADYEDEMLDLFDAMMSTMKWPAPTATVASA
ncbi:hypothetical protein IWX81_002729 [Salinibacterium sp. CAN_S4]|uniref:hypothetical protein n=1 Tax=Salinibacterium sp. CAN_S4 TaxID=2787727 RepID=UPI0018F0273E